MIRLPANITAVIILMLASASYSLSAQGDKQNPWSAGADFVSTFVWRGTRQGIGPHIQPVIEYSKGSLTAGAWGSSDFRGYEEVDLYVSFDIPGGFKVGLQDYYLPELSLFNLSAVEGSHAVEVSLAYSSEHLSLEAGYIVNEAGGIGSYGGDLYLEGAVDFDFFSLFLGAGNGWHTENGSFNVCSLGLSAAREITVTDSFSIPVTGQLIFNPDSEKMFLVVGFTFIH